MECAGIAEAGGVKNVTFSLCKEFSELGNDVTLFMPVYKCTSYELIKDLKKNAIKNVIIHHCGKEEKVSYSTGKCIDGDFSIVFINHPSFSQKEDVYTYTQNEQKNNPENVKGTGHKDTLFMDSLFAKGVAEYCRYVEKADKPNIVHCQDASTSLIPVFLKNHNLLPEAKTVVTIHNAGPAYHHNYSDMNEARYYTELGDEELLNATVFGRVEPFLLAYNAGAALTTVSEQYAEELVNPELADATEGLSAVFAERKIKVTGITNGIDYERYNPENTEISKLPYAFNPEKNILDGKYQCRESLLEMLDSGCRLEGISQYGSIEGGEKCVYISYHGRLTTQKGLSVLIEAVPYILGNFDNVRFIITGQGELALEEVFKLLAEEYKGKLVFLNGYNKEIARLTTVAGDFIVLPSFFEPCGLEDFIAQIYGTIPVAHRTGGLNKIIDGKTGFLYEVNNCGSLVAKLSEVTAIKNCNPKIIERMIKDAAVYVHKNYMWNHVVKEKYLVFFEALLKK
jgi:starch synthase